MLFDDDQDDIRSDKGDLFDEESNARPKPKEEKKPKYKEDDPAYWEEEESDWEHLKPASRAPFWLWVIAALVVIGLIIGCWIRYFSPYVEDATQYGYVENIEKRGSIFKTYEGTLIPYRELMDTTRIYSRDFIFSVEDNKTAATLKEALYNAKPVRVGYKKYHATLPWRGANKIVVTSADTVSPDKILPPEFAPRKQ
ncbi:MAG: hypothetical protein J1E82_02115 [Muribaculaceae bacterium]|nr:hypothetical protein [Muribaculaceae bacterium]